MRKLYFLVVFVISFATQAQIVNIPDASFKNKLLQLGVDSNFDGDIQTTEALQVTELFIYNTQISSLEGISNFTNLQTLDCSQNSINSLDLSGLFNLQNLDCSENQLIFLNLNNLTNLQNLRCSSNLLTNLNVEGLYNIQNLECFYNQLNSINIEGLINIQDLDCSYNQLTSLNVQGLNSLLYLKCNNNQISSLNIEQFYNLIILECSHNQLTSLILHELFNIEFINCSYNQLINIDIQEMMNIHTLNCNNNQLISINIKNGNIENYLYLSNNPNLQYICCDENQIQDIEILVSTNGQNCQVNSYCSFVPNGIFYTIQGNTKLDSNANGCDISDIDFSNLNFTITDGTNSGTFISNTSGNYSIPVQAGNHTITPVLENPTYFNISSTSFIANFPTQTSPLNQDFCVTPNGTHHDVEVTFIPTNPARPGFDANYTIIYKNKGNQIENGTVTLDFNDAVLDLVSANPTFSSQGTNSLTFDYSNLQPLEIRTIDLVLNVNSPTENPAVNIGDQLNYTATITPFTTDEFQYDNTSGLKQIVVGSYDPNDKTCVEGTTVGPDMIGQYVHYVIRFENTGTYAAENIVVKDMIDLAKFDINTLIPLHSSHDFVTRIAGNKVEFIFEGINLPFDDANNDGYIAFKIKMKSNLVVGNTFSNDASIYFDYNFPITTNTFTTAIAALKVTDFDFGKHFTLYPNPVKDILNFQSKGNTTINSIEIYNTLGQVVLAVPNAISTVDVSNLQSGNYFVKVNTDLGVSNTKFIKE